jgi:hypothetical protein
MYQNQNERIVDHVNEKNYELVERLSQLETVKAQYKEAIARCK